MAAIDKLYLKNYYELENLRLWAMIYYPKLLLYFYSGALTIDAEEFLKYKNKCAKAAKKAYVRNWVNISPDNTVNGAVAYLMAEPYNYTEKEATEEAQIVYKNSRMSVTDLVNTESLPVMNTPLKVDRKLKWICPLSCIREYLQRQCGVKEHWYYKLFWKGKKYFL